MLSALMGGLTLLAVTKLDAEMKPSLVAKFGLLVMDLVTLVAVLITTQTIQELEVAT